MRLRRGAAWLALVAAGAAVGQAALPRNRPASAEALLVAHPAGKAMKLALLRCASTAPFNK